MIRNRIKITTHAKQRLRERLPEVHPNNYQTLVSAARYRGTPVEYLIYFDPMLLDYVENHFDDDNITHLRYYHGCIFVFRGPKRKGRVLVTVVNIAKNIEEEIEAINSKNAINDAI